MADVMTGETPTYPGGLDLILAYSAEQAAALGDDATELADYADTALWALAALRSGGVIGEGRGPSTSTADFDWAVIVGDLTRLSARVKVLLTHAIVQHAEVGGTLGPLSAAMGGVARSTAETRRIAAREKIGEGGPLDGWATIRPQSGTSGLGD